MGLFYRAREDRSVLQAHRLLVIYWQVFVLDSISEAVLILYRTKMIMNSIISATLAKHSFNRAHCTSDFTGGTLHPKPKI